MDTQTGAKRDMSQILTSIALYEVLQKHGYSEEEAYRIVPFGFKKGSGYGWRYTWHKDDPKDEFNFECNECIYAKILGKRDLKKGRKMLLTIYLAIVILAAVTVMMLSAVAFIQDEKMFSSAPKEVRELIRPRQTELFYGARTIGWTLFVFSILMIIGALVTAAWDGIRSGFTFWQFFIRFLVLFTVYKVYDMVFFDYFWLLKFRFFQYYYPEAGNVMEGRKYGFNIGSQLLKLLVIFPEVSALAAWVCSLLSL